jgi:beta-glucosidase
VTWPEGFGWGAGLASTIVSGAAPGSDLAAWSGADASTTAGNGFDTSFAGDLTLLASLGVSDVRLTLDWTRIEPADGTIDTAAVEHLRLVLGAAREAGLRVWGCLVDGPLPGWFAIDEHGFADVRSRRYYWARHTERIAETFGDLVHGWVPVYEPNRWALRGWLDGSRPPGRIDDAEGFSGALEAIHLASVDAALRLRQDGQPVATAQWIAPVFPARLDPGSPPTPDAEAMASLVDEALRGCWTRLLTEETLVVPGRSPVEVPDARGAFDVIGFTYRHALAVRGDGALGPYPQQLPVGADGHVAWSEGFALTLHRLAETFDERPLLAAGVGMATDNEDQRAEYLRDVLVTAETAVDDGIDLRGLWWDTPIDGAAPAAVVRRGLFDLDRSPRPAADLLGSVIAGAPVPR